MILLILFIICFIIIWWGYFGYFHFLYLTVQRKKQGKPVSVTNVSLSVTILVPCFNEESTIAEKIANLKSLKYSREKLQVLFLDGLSTDATVGIISDHIRNCPWMRVIQTNVRGKIQQINTALPNLESDVILITDADGRMEENALLALVQEFIEDPSVGVVGGLVIPQNCSPEELHHWKVQNEIRVLESHAYSSSVAIAVFCAFRRGFIRHIPNDVIADDAYIPFESNRQGYRVIYSPRVLAFETRAAMSIREFFKHKYRKANATMKESLRFLPFFFRYTSFWKIIFVTRALQVLALPVITVLFFFFSVASRKMSSRDRRE